MNTIALEAAVRISRKAHALAQQQRLHAAETLDAFVIFRESDVVRIVSDMLAGAPIEISLEGGDEYQAELFNYCLTEATYRHQRNGEIIPQMTLDQLLLVVDDVILMIESE